MMPLLLYSTAHMKSKTQNVFYYGRHTGYTFHVCYQYETHGLHVKRN